jgi:hypothetical protein
VKACPCFCRFLEYNYSCNNICVEYLQDVSYKPNNQYLDWISIWLKQSLGKLCTGFTIALFIWQLIALSSLSPPPHQTGTFRHLCPLLCNTLHTVCPLGSKPDRSEMKNMWVYTQMMNYSNYGFLASKASELHTIQSQLSMLMKGKTFMNRQNAHKIWSSHIFGRPWLKIWFIHFSQKPQDGKKEVIMMYVIHTALTTFLQGVSLLR